MELDDLKKAWTRDGAGAGLPAASMAALLTKKIASSRNHVYRNVVIEFSFVILIYVVMISAMIIFRHDFNFFFYKTIGVVTLISIPILVRLIRSARKLVGQDMAVPLTDHLEEGLAHFRQTIRIYRIFSYIAIGILLLVYATDEFFLSLSRTWKAGIIGYLLFFAWITSPYLKWFYGKRISEMEVLLGQLKGMD